ncbi:hypothetical protein NMY22_g16429 [Coprinellus aureogranulatus]|nr:hypothetical protein NMY22_g16429 [Coprinellus aureogranulatus]
MPTHAQIQRVLQDAGDCSEPVSTDDFLSANPQISCAGSLRRPTIEMSILPTCGRDLTREVLSLSIHAGPPLEIRTVNSSCRLRSVISIQGMGTLLKITAHNLVWTIDMCSAK